MGVADMTRVWGWSDFFRQAGPLGHPEAVLLVGDHQGQAGKFHPLGKQGVGADAQVDAAVSKLLVEGALFLGGKGSR